MCNDNKLAEIMFIALKKIRSLYFPSYTLLFQYFQVCVQAVFESVHIIISNLDILSLNNCNQFQMLQHLNAPLCLSSLAWKYLCQHLAIIRCLTLQFSFSENPLSSMSNLGKPLNMALIKHIMYCVNIFSYYDITTPGNPYVFMHIYTLVSPD